jgi:DNA repair protein RadD
MELRNYQKIKLEKGENNLLVLPTGSGKSLIIADLIRQYKDKKFLILAHRANLIAANEEKVRLIASAKTSVYCAELGRKEIGDVTLATRGSLANLEQVPQFDFIVIDEVHLLNEEKGQYFSILEKQGVFLEKPRCNIIGLTATPWRKNKPIFGDNKLFQKANVTLYTNDLIDQGYLAPYVFPKLNKKDRFNTDGIKITAGDFNLSELNDLVIDVEIIRKQLQIWHDTAKDRTLTLFFCAGVRHAELVHSMIVQAGFLTASEAVTITGDTEGKVELIKSIASLKSPIKAICSCEVLTTGTDIPRIDCVALMRPTSSASLHIQMTGRGLRLSPDKNDCLFLDFAGNMRRFGSINKPFLGSKGQEVFLEEKEITVESDKVLPTKKCSKCYAENMIAARFCSSCKNLFIKANDIYSEGEKGIIEIKQINKWKVPFDQFKTYSGKPCDYVMNYLTDDGYFREYIFSTYKYKQIFKQNRGDLCFILAKTVKVKNSNVRFVNVSNYFFKKEDKLFEYSYSKRNLTSIPEMILQNEYDYNEFIEEYT